MTKRLIVAITGATGAIYGVRLLEALKAAQVETHLVLSKWGQQTVEHETGLTLADLQERAAVVHGTANMAATISSGSYRTDGMIIAPCSMRTVGAIAHSNGDNLVHRAADVVLKERRKMVLVPRETPLSEIHLENLLKLARMGVVILPPMPAFYNRPATLDDIVNHVVARVLDQFDIEASFAKRWDGEMTHAVPVRRMK
ncbi:MAG: phenolic acid decarboxylase subunit B [Betaproteobacteria bacterium RIFCSPLOWO2_12_FULL_65_14]|nr:MAG: phenolic acid decarboxylase subunit B [Betaproteobacteria bacterium RIFCSPLOWO2_12_FULL_65_14]